MKKQFLLIAFFGLLSIPVISQKYAFIDTKYILSQMPEYTTAQKEIDDMAEKWQKEIEQQYNEIEQKYKACLLYTSPSPRDVEESRMPSSA